MILPRSLTPTLTVEAERLTHDALVLQGIQILAVDDEGDNLELVTFILEQVGATVITARSATAALQILEQTPVDLLLADIGMPKVDGYTLLRQLRERPPEQGGQIPAIALTAYAGELDQQRSLAAGFQMHLSKPVEPARLVEVIAEILSKSPA